MVSMPADPSVQDQQTTIGLADQSFNFRAGEARFVAHPNGGNPACLDPFAHRHWV
jgi:hypothetical protein